MWDYIDKLREKPHHHRKRIAVGTSAAITSVVFLAWLSTFSISPVLPVGFASEQQAAVAEGISPFALIKESFVAAIGQAGNQLGSEASKRSPVTAGEQNAAATSTLLRPAGPEDRPY